jgi:hypothetical protein
MSANKPKESLINKIKRVPDETDKLKDIIHVETAVFFDGMSMFFAFIGAMEFGFLYATLISLVLMVYAFQEMMRMRARKDKESHI